MIRQSTSRVSQVLPADFAFSRASTGYNTKGKLYMPNQLRLESSIYGGAVALVEEATTNLITNGDCETVLPMLNNLNSQYRLSAELSNNYSHFGSKSLKLTTDTNSSSDRIYGLGSSTAMNGLIAGTTYTFSAWMYVPSGSGITLSNVKLAIGYYVSSNIITNSDLVTAYDTWQKLIVTVTIPIDAIYAFARVRITEDIHNVSIYVDDLQFEAKSYPASWTPGTRAAESLTMPVLATNLLTPNLASVESGTTGFTANTGAETLTRDTTEYKYGSASLKVVTPGNVINEGFYTSQISASASLAYTISLWAKGAGTIKLILYEYTSTGSAVGATTVTVTLSDIWTRYSVTRSLGSTGALVRLLVQTLTVQAATFYADGLQLELGPYATTWNLPAGATPRMGLPVEHGTIEGIVEITDIVKRTSGNRGIINIPSTTLSYGIILYCPNGSSNFNLGTFTDATTFKEVTILSSLIPNGWYYYKVYWTVSEAIVEFWDLLSQIKVAYATISDPTLPAAFATNAHLGAYTASTYFANTRFGKHQLSNIARTDDPDFNNLMPRDSNTVALMDFDDITFRANQCMVI